MKQGYVASTSLCLYVLSRVVRYTSYCELELKYLKTTVSSRPVLPVTFGMEVGIVICAPDGPWDSFGLGAHGWKEQRRPNWITLLVGNNS